MKKVLLLAAVAFGAVVAQAVTYTWNSTQNAFVDSAGNAMCFYTDITSLKITVKYANMAQSANFIHSYFAIQNKASSGANGKIEMSVGKGIKEDGSETTAAGRANYSYTTAGGTSGSFSDDDNHFSAVRAWQSLDNTILFDFSGVDSNGALSSVTVTHTFYNATATVTQKGEFDFNGVALDELVVYADSRVTSATIEIEGTPDPLPEPGALALLALGAGALTLRRKVARA